MALKYSGYGTWSTPDSAVVTERDSVRCNHCEYHFWVQPGSGKTRGFCMICMKPTCGAEACLPCVPFEEKMIREAQRHQLFQSMGLE